MNMGYVLEIHKSDKDKYYKEFNRLGYEWANGKLLSEYCPFDFDADYCITIFVYINHKRLFWDNEIEVDSRYEPISLEQLQKL